MELSQMPQDTGLPTSGLPTPKWLSLDMALPGLSAWVTWSSLFPSAELSHRR